MSAFLGTLRRCLDQTEVIEGEIHPREILCETIEVEMRDGIRLVTDVYRPRIGSHPVICLRTPYGRMSNAFDYVAAFHAFARHGYAVVSQDCRGTGESEPDEWDYYVYETEDGWDLIEWVTKQEWASGFIGSCGGSYVGQTQWCMALHPAMTAIVPRVSGLGIAFSTLRLHIMQDVLSKSIGKGPDKADIPYQQLEKLMWAETLMGGLFNEPFASAKMDGLPKAECVNYAASAAEVQSGLWRHYSSLSSKERAEFIALALGVPHVTPEAVERLPSIFGYRISHDAHTIPRADPAALCKEIQAPALIRTGWYDWCLNDAILTWRSLKMWGCQSVAEKSRLIIAPTAHNMPGYKVDAEHHAELLNPVSLLRDVPLHLAWYDHVAGKSGNDWPQVAYYLTGANHWCQATDWPPLGATPKTLHLKEGGRLAEQLPSQSGSASYVYDPEDPTPTVGGNVVSSVITPGSADLAQLHRRKDLLCFTTEPLEQDLNVIGSLCLRLFAASSAKDTDFIGRLSDVHPDGRVIQLQSAGLRARYRDPDGNEAPLIPGQVTRFDIDLWSIAHVFKRGHCLRLDIASADFPRFDRNSNVAGEDTIPRPAEQRIFWGPDYPSALLVEIANPEPLGVDG